MGNEQQAERRATVLAFASVFGDVAAARKYGCTDRAVRIWRRRMVTDEGLREAYTRKREMLDGVAVDEAAARVEAMRYTPRRGGGGRPRDRTFALAVARAAEACALRAGLPAVKAAEVDLVLPSRHVVDLALTHEDGSRSLCMVSSRKHSWADGQTLGHLLLCYEGARAEFGGARLVVFADHDAGPLWERAASHVNLKVAFVNVSDFLGVRPEA